MSQFFTFSPPAGDLFIRRFKGEKKMCFTDYRAETKLDHLHLS